jgi:hypothetical protein
MVDDGKSVGLRHNAPTSPVSKGTESALDTKSNKTGGLTDSHKIIAFKVSHLLVSLLVVWFW